MKVYYLREFWFHLLTRFVFLVLLTRRGPLRRSWPFLTCWAINYFVFCFGFWYFRLGSPWN